MSNLKQWQDFLGLIKAELTNQAYQTWFESLVVIDRNAEQITLQVPNRFHYEWVESKYGRLVKESVLKCFGENIAINYSVLVQQDQEPQEVAAQKIDKLIPTSFHRPSQLNNRYIFSNFIEGRGNQFAKAAACSVADGPGQTPFNPLLVYSNPGLGKTHLIQGIGNHILKHHPSLKIVYVTSEKSNMSKCVRNVETLSFYYRNRQGQNFKVPLKSPTRFSCAGPFKLNAETYARI